MSGLPQVYVEKKLGSASLTVAVLVILLVIVLILTALLWLLIGLLLTGLLLAGLTAVLALSGLTTLFLFHIFCHEKFLLAKHELPRASKSICKLVAARDCRVGKDLFVRFMNGRMLARTGSRRVTFERKGRARFESGLPPARSSHGEGHLAQRRLCGSDYSTTTIARRTPG